MAKNEFIQIRISHEEKTNLETMSRIEGFDTLSDYVRNICTTRTVPNKEEVLRDLELVLNSLQLLIYKIKKM